MKHTKKFEAHTDYVSYKNSQNYLKPNVSYCGDKNELHFEKYSRDYSKEYLTTEALETGTISFNIWKSMGTEYITSISYSTDNGETWVTTNNINDKQEDLTITVNVNEGDKVSWKGDAQQTGVYDEEEYNDNVGSFFSSTAEFNVYGNVMSLIYGDNFYGENTLEWESQFSCLFNDYNRVKKCKVINAKNLLLVATTLTPECYFGMFENCTLLTTAPSLLPATTLANNCYGYMFNACKALTTAPELPATTLAISCYFYMFSGCKALTTAPELPATIMKTFCYGNMFYGCTSLTTAPELPATTLASSCYSYMFYLCSSLTTAPKLPATTLATSCYVGMFRSCSSLTTAPELPATTLANSCYNYMFDGCSNLNYIKAMFTTTPTISYTRSWVGNVSSTGTFIKNSAATWNVTGINGVPSGWTIETAN